MSICLKKEQGENLMLEIEEIWILILLNRQAGSLGERYQCLGKIESLCEMVGPETVSSNLI